MAGVVGSCVMDMMYVVVILGAIVAGFVQGLSGFAFGLISMSFWVWVLDPQLAAMLAIFGAMTGQMIQVFSMRRGIDVKRLMPFIIGGLCGVPLGMMILPQLNIPLFKTILGVFLVIWCPAIIFIKKLPPITAGGRAADGVVGIAGGIMTAIGGMTGAIPTLWCTLRGFERSEQRAIIQNFNLTLLTVTMAAYVFSGRIAANHWPMFGIVAVSMVIPTIIGTKVYVGVSDETFRKMVLSLLTLSGIALLFSGVPELMTS
jgi:uncharacterized membrane protein YfcA